MRRLSLRTAPVTLVVAVVHLAIMTCVIAATPGDALLMALRALSALTFASWFVFTGAWCEQQRILWRGLILMVYAFMFAGQGIVCSYLVGTGPFSFWGVNFAAFFTGVALMIFERCRQVQASAAP